MRIRTSLAVLAVAGFSLALAVPATAATVHPDAGAVLTYSGGTAVGVNDTLTGALASGTKATFYNAPTGSTGVACGTSTFSAKVLTNPTAPGTATESLTAQTFSNCTSNVVGVTGVNSITVNNLPYKASLSDASGFPVSVTPTTGLIQTTVNIQTVLGAANCVYTGPSINGNASNTDNSLTFVNQHFTKASGSGLCFTDAYFSVKYAPVVDATHGNAAVSTN